MIHNEHSIQRPFAVICNVSGPFGSEIARQFAARGFDLIVASPDGAAEELRTKLEPYGVFIEGYCLDLHTFDSVEKLCAAIKDFGHPVDALVISADLGPHGHFVEGIDLKQEIETIRKNVLAPVHLLKRVLVDMVVRGHGRILISSTSEGTPHAPYEAVSTASRAFLYSLTESIRTEVRDAGITVTSMLPNQYDMLNELDHHLDPEELAQESFDALMGGRDYVFTATLKTKLAGMLSRAKNYVSTARNEL